MPVGPETTRIVVNIPKDLHPQLKAAAEKEQRSMSNMVLYLITEYLKSKEESPMKFVLNLKDASGCIRGGYEDVLVGTRDEVIDDYLDYIHTHVDETVTEEDIDCKYVDWE